MIAWASGFNIFIDSKSWIDGIQLLLDESKPKCIKVSVHRVHLPPTLFCSFPIMIIIRQTMEVTEVNINLKSTPKPAVKGFVNSWM